MRCLFGVLVLTGFMLAAVGCDGKQGTTMPTNPQTKPKDPPKVSGAGGNITGGGAGKTAD